MKNHPKHEHNAKLKTCILESIEELISLLKKITRLNQIKREGLNKIEQISYLESLKLKIIRVHWNLFICIREIKFAKRAPGPIC